MTPKPNFLCFTLSPILKPNVSSTFFTSSGITIVFFVFISVFFFSNLLNFSECFVSENSSSSKYNLSFLTSTSKSFSGISFKNIDGVANLS